MEANDFQCVMCGEAYEKGWTDEEAKVEAKDLWGIEKGPVVCDDCFNKIHPEKNLELARKFGYRY